MSQYTAVISLGSSCEAAFALTDYFGAKRINSFFDWLVTPIESLINVLNTDGAGVGEDFGVVFAGTSVICRRYGLLYHHEFPRDDGRIVFSREAVDRCRGKLRHKFDVFRDVTRNNKTLFIREAIATDVPGDRYADGAIAASALNGVASTLETFTRRNDFEIVIVLKNGVARGRRFDDRIKFDVELDKRINIVSCAMFEDLPAAGDEATYSQVFLSRGLTRVNGAKAPASAAVFE